MSDFLEVIAAHEDAIIRQWARALRDMDYETYGSIPDEALLASVQRSARALLHVMQTGDAEAVATMLRESAAKHKHNGATYGQTAAIWLLYRQAVQRTLQAQMTADDWEQLVDRVDGIIDWVLDVLRGSFDED